MKKERIKGLIAAIVTPMNKDGNVNASAIPPYADYLIKKGVDGVFVCGTTGEGLLMDNEERKKMAEAWMCYADKLKILIHVGSTSYKMSAALAQHAQQIGADAISVMGPCFLQPDRTRELVLFNKEIAKHAPDIPYYYYHIPMTSGVKVDMLDFLKEAKDEIPSLNGIKYTSYNTMEMQECIEYENYSFDILHGHDESLINGLLLGATGGIGTTYNVTAPLYKKLLTFFYEGKLKEAVSIQSEAVKFIQMMQKYGNSVVSIKAILNILGVDCGPCRLPLRNLSKEELMNLENDLNVVEWL
jgi:N-acetylneuraminate lyase